MPFKMTVKELFMIEFLLFMSFHTISLCFRQVLIGPYFTVFLHTEKSACYFRPLEINLENNVQKFYMRSQG